MEGTVLYINLVLELELDVAVNAWNPSTTKVGQVEQKVKAVLSYMSLGQSRLRAL